MIDELWRIGYEDDRLRHHVWDHGVNTYEILSEIRAELRAQGVSNVPGEFMTHLDGKGHDYLFAKYADMQLRGDKTYDSAEHLTTVEGAAMLRKVGIDDYTINEWAEHIPGTQLGKICTSLGAYTLCAADMANTGKDFATVMRPATENLRLEKSLLEQTNAEPIKFDIGAIAVISRYHFVNLGLLRFVNKSSIMRELHLTRGVNLGKLVLETTANTGAAGEDAIKSFLTGLGGYAINLLPFCRREDQRN